jgi:flagellar basal-body rod protein FlgC
MLSSSLNNALSGLNLASTKLSVSAKNIANFRSTSQTIDGSTVINEPYQPEMVSQTTTSTGNVLGTIQKTNLDPIVVFDATHPDADENGIVEYPNVDLGEERVNQIIASAEFKANLNIIQKAQETEDTIFDILT